ncbi:MAG TPA: sigma-54 dependent transcriptional regulator [Polyangiaceae bacterium]|nr:sigma-54 dependent transcriptional regulator [Polyangiaceae bacterium]
MSETFSLEPESRALQSSDVSDEPSVATCPPSSGDRARPRCGVWYVEVALPTGTTVRVLGPGRALTLGNASGVDLRVDDPSAAFRIRLTARYEGLHLSDENNSSAIHLGRARVNRAWITESRCGFVIGRTAVNVRWGQEGAGIDSDAEPIPGLIGNSLPMRRLCREIRRFAELGAPVLLHGETGTGKDVVARALHRLSNRRGEFVALNVGGLNENIADAELFGYRRGAFTGAVQSRVGVFEAAAGGTLFLDEIGDLHPSIQVKLLRVIEDRQIRPLGTNECVNVTARIVSASWASLEERLGEGGFRMDLYHRISTIRLEIPALRQRKGDIPLLSEHLLARYADEVGPKSLTPSALARLLEYEWRGNVRELGSVLYRAAAAVKEEAFIDLPVVERALPNPIKRRPRGLSREDLQRLLEENEGNVSAAARAARVPRSTFRTLLKRQTLRPKQAA